jgi:hypothetical protein
MTNITRAVERIIEHDSAIRKDLARGLINKRSLAIYLQESAGIKGSTDAIISSIRRHEPDLEGQNHFSKAMGLIKNAKISTKTGIAMVALAKDPAVQQTLPRLFSVIQYTRGEILRIIQAEEELKIVVDEKNAQKVEELFKKADVMKVEHNLAELNMRLVPASAKVPGILAILNTELANIGVNIVETISCVPELLWFIDQKDLLKAHQAFLELTGSKDNLV